MPEADVRRQTGTLESDSRRLPATAEGYELVEQIGSGSGTGGTVFRAICAAIGDEVAVRIIDLDELTASLEDISRDVTVMSLSSHPNVVPFSTCFVAGNDLWVVMPLLSGGSVSSLLACHYEKGLPPKTAVYILHSTLRALDYFHSNNQIHRDVRGANIMLDAHGQAMLSDYGMMGWMVEGGWETQQRQTFVGTPCWMAPEVMEQTGGYDYKADVWSLGITAIELAMGAAPYVNYQPMKVLIMTMKNPSPTITGHAAEIFPDSYKDFIALCLEKDPSMRPSAKELLDHSLFKDVGKPSDLEAVLASLPPLGSRGGTTQRELYRRMQKAVAPAGAGLWSRRKGEGWDFSDDEDEDEVFGLLPSADPGEASRSGQVASGGMDSAAAERSATTAGLPPALPSSIAASRSFTSTDDGMVVHSSSGGLVDPALHPVTPTDSMSRTTVSITPATTPSVTPANHMSTPALSPPTDGDGRVSLPPTSSNGDASAAPMTVLPTAVASGLTATNSSGVPSLPSKGSGMQKKGRFTVSDVDVSAPGKVNQKVGTFVEEEMEMSVGGSQNTSNSVNGAISNSSSFTSIPAPSTETSPTSAVPTAAPVSGRTVLPVGIDSSSGQGVGGISGSAPTSKDQARSKARFEVAPVDSRGNASGGGGLTTVAVKTRNRVASRDIGDGVTQGGGADVPSAAVNSGGPPSAGLGTTYSKSPKASPPPAGPPSTGSLPSMRSRENIPAPAVRQHPSAGSNLPLQTSFAGSTSVVQAYSNLISTLGLECESLRGENEGLRRELAHLRSSHEADLAASRNHILHQQQQLFAQQAQHDKLIQQLVQKVQQLQRTDLQSSHQPAQVKVLGQPTSGQARSHAQAHSQGRAAQGQSHQSPAVSLSAAPSSSSTSVVHSAVPPVSGHIPQQPTGTQSSSGQQALPSVSSQPPSQQQHTARVQQVSSRQGHLSEQARQMQVAPVSTSGIPQSQAKAQTAPCLPPSPALEVPSKQPLVPQISPPQQSGPSVPLQQTRQSSTGRPPAMGTIAPVQGVSEGKGGMGKTVDPLEAALAGTSPPSSSMGLTGTGHSQFVAMDEPAPSSSVPSGVKNISSSSSGTGGAQFGKQPSTGKESQPSTADSQGSRNSQLRSPSSDTG